MSAAFLISTISIPHGLQTEAAGISDINELKSSIQESAIDYMKSCVLENGSVGDYNLINDTAEYVDIMTDFTEEDCTKQLTWINNNKIAANVDVDARKIMATNDSNSLNQLLSNQNKDGGYGLTDRYQSDNLDSILALEAVNDVESQSENSLANKLENWRLVNYLSRQSQSNGGYGYQANSSADVKLTAMALNSVSEYMNQHRIQSEVTTNMMKKTCSYLTTELPLDDLSPKDLSEENFEDVLYSLIAVQQYKGISNLENTLKTLKEKQMKDGSFYHDEHDTALVVRFLGMLDRT